MNARTDIHRPSAIEPENYYLVAILCWPKGGAIIDFEALRYERERLASHMKDTGGKYAQHEHGGNCHVCGAWFIDHAVYYHHLTKSYLNIGFDCAMKMDIGDARAFRNFRTARKAAVELKAGKTKAKAILEEAGHANVWEMFERFFSDSEAINAYVEPLSNSLKWKTEGNIHTVIDIVYKLIKYGDISDKALAFVATLPDRILNVEETQAKWDAEAAAAKPVPFEGRQEFEGTIISKRLVESDYGNTMKITVKHADGWRVWVTLPSSAYNYDVGDSIELRANITISDDDPKFAFAKRPHLLSEEKDSS